MTYEKPKFEIWALKSNASIEYFFESVDKASKALAEKMQELNSRWHTHSLSKVFEENSKERFLKKFTIVSGGWDASDITWEIIPIPVY